MERVEALSELEQAPDMKKGHPIFTWKQRVLSDMGSYEEDDIDISNVHGGKDDTVLDGNNEDNDEETVGDDLIIDEGDDEIPLNFEEEVGTNYISEEDSVHEDDNGEQQESEQ